MFVSTVILVELQALLSKTNVFARYVIKEKQCHVSGCDLMNVPLIITNPSSVHGLC